MNHLFEPFFTTKEVGKGTGLGLATVYGITKQHRGWIDVTSQVGRGSTFCVYLPALSEGPPAGPEAARVEAKRGSETILLVEDEELVRQMVAMTLSRNDAVEQAPPSGKRLVVNENNTIVGHSPGSPNGGR